MKAEYINPFIEAARDVVQTEMGSELEIGKLTLDKTLFIKQEVKVMIGVTGQLEGVAFYALSKETSVKLTETMLGESLPEFNEIVHSAIAELGNVISGMAGAKLEQLGFSVNITTPTVIIGPNSKVNAVQLAPLVVPLETNVGDIILTVALREKRK